ncbi:hypothetical protein MTO96_030907 [Rhipicephalus appendiculatus]
MALIPAGMSSDDVRVLTSLARMSKDSGLRLGFAVLVGIHCEHIMNPLQQQVHWSNGQCDAQSPCADHVRSINCP